MRSGGSTLIELMITVAIIGIAASAGVDGILQVKRHSAFALQRERALQVLEYEAAAVVSARPVDAAASRALLEQIPEGKLESRRSNGVRTLRVSWRSARGGNAQREIVLLETSR